MSETTAPSRASPAPPTELVEELERQGIAPGSYDFRPLDGLRRLIARRMLESVQAAPHFAVQMRIEMDALLTLRARLNEASDARVSVNDLLIRASALALKAHPDVNASYTASGIVTHHHADVAFAVAMDGGLVTPIIRAAETKSPAAIAAESRELAARGRVKRLRPEEYNGGTFSVSNLGMFGVAAFEAIINPPQSCILSVGAAEKAYVFDGDQPRVATLLLATLNCDHRLVDGALGARWLQTLKALLEAPEQLLGA